MVQNATHALSPNTTHITRTTSLGGRFFAFAPLSRSRRLRFRAHWRIQFSKSIAARFARPLRLSHHLRHLMLFNANQSRQHQQTRQFTVARTPSITRKRRKWAENGRRTRHARKTVLTRNRPAHTPRTPTHTRRTHPRASRTPTHAHMHAHTRQRMHTHTRTHAHAHPRAPTHTHTHTHTLAPAGAPAPAHTRDPERAALRARLQVRCTRAVCRSERDGGREASLDVTRSYSRSGRMGIL